MFVKFQQRVHTKLVSFDIVLLTFYAHVYCELFFLLTAERC